jgi:hypothetical protein
VQLVLVVFSVALLAMSVLFDVAALTWHSKATAEVAAVNLEAAIAAALVSGVIATLRVLLTPAWSRARSLASYRAAAQLATAALAAAALALRQRPLPPGAFLLLSIAAASAGALSAWLAGEDAGSLGEGW